MRVYPDRNEKEDPNAVDQVLDFTQGSYRKFNDYVEFRPNDPIWMLGYKLVLRFIGVLIMIALSPFLIIGLTIAFAAVF